MRILLCLVGLAVGTCFPVPAFSLTGDLTNDPAKVVDKYLSLDKRGVRLTAQTYESVKPYVAWEQEEPVWNRFVVIRDYSISDDVTQWNVVNSTEAFIPVTFQVLGVVHVETATFVPGPREHGAVSSYPSRGQSLENGGAGVPAARRPEPFG